MKKIPRHLVPLPDSGLTSFQQIGERVAASKKLASTRELVIEAWDALTEKEQLYVVSSAMNGMLNQVARCSVLMREIACFDDPNQQPDPSEGGSAPFTA
jgi:hypothetical protein